MRQAIGPIAMAIVCIAGWLTIGWLIVDEDVGRHGLLSAAGVSALFLYVAIPFVSFLPLARSWNAPLYDVEAAVGWGGLLAVVTFVRPSSPLTLWQVIAALAPLTMACATLLTALAYCVVNRMNTRKRNVSIVDARRRGYLGAIALVVLGLLGGLGALSPVHAVLLLSICLLIEALFYTRGRELPEGIRSTQGS
jgi:hypothetical protein